jgi:hypothetical protein
MRPVTILIFAALAAACSTMQTRNEPDKAEVILAAPESQVRAVVVQVLRADGYEVQRTDARVLSTEYRQEIDSVWDPLLVHHFGVGRSRVDVTMTPDSNATTRLNIQVIHQGKDSLFSSWRAYDAPLAQSAANQIRLVRNALGLL